MSVRSTSRKNFIKESDLMLHRFCPPLKSSVTRRSAKGVTLLELAMYLGIAGIIAGGSLAAFSGASNARQVAETLSMIGQVQQAVRSLSQGAPDYAGITTASVARSGQISRKYMRSYGDFRLIGTTLTHPFKGNLIVVTTAGNARFAISASSLPRDACTKLAPIDMGPGVASVTVASGTVASPPVDLPADPAITPSMAISQCRATVNTITWEFF